MVFKVIDCISFTDPLVPFSIGITKTNLASPTLFKRFLVFFSKELSKKTNFKIFFIDVRFVSQTYMQPKNKKHLSV
jgi:hypothetical protein